MSERRKRLEVKHFGVDGRPACKPRMRRPYRLAMLFSAVDCERCRRTDAFQVVRVRYRLLRAIGRRP